MKINPAQLWKEYGWRLLLDAGLTLFFIISMVVLFTLRTSASTWALIPHVLCNASLFVLLLRQRSMGRPSMYWSHFDFAVVLLFLYFIVNIYYSEVRAVSWRTVALYLDSLGAYFLGRMLFYHRLRVYVLSLVAGLALSWLGATVVRQQALSAEAGFKTQVAAAASGTSAEAVSDKADYQHAIAENMVPVRKTALLFLSFWALSMPFLLLQKPKGLAFFVYTVAILGAYGLYATARLSWFWGVGQENAVGVRHERVQSLLTAGRILQNYPFTGGGAGTFKYMYNAYRLTPASTLTAGFNSYVYCAVELGLIAVTMLLYLFVRLPLHIVRRWRLFPNRQLRFAILVLLCFVVLFVLQGFHDPFLFTPHAWFVAWSAIGTLIGLVMVRDPIRIFEQPWPAPRAVETEAPRRRFYASLGSPFGRTPTAKLPAVKPSIWRRMQLGQVMIPVVATVLLFALTCAEAAPYLSLRLTRLQSGEVESSPTYGERLLEASRIFPLSSETWSKLGEYYRAQASSPLDIFQYSDKISSSYLKAIELNRYTPLNYEMLYYLYRDINNSPEALRVIKQGVQDNPNELVLRLLLVIELEKIGSLALATYHVKQALFRIAPDKVELYLRLAELYLYRGKATDATLYYQYAKQVVSDNPQVNARLRTLREKLKLPS